MELTEVEILMRRVVREELSALLDGRPLPEVPQRRPAPDPQGREHPFLLTDAEVAQAEALLPEAERPILRRRVYAARLEQQGNNASAMRMRRQADSLEKRLRAQG